MVLSMYQIKAIVMDKLRKRGCWGARYAPTDSIINWLSKKIKKNGKRIRKAVKQLIKEGYLIPHKGGRTISLNPSKSREIINFIEKFTKE